MTEQDYNLVREADPAPPPPYGRRRGPVTDHTPGPRPSLTDWIGFACFLFAILAVGFALGILFSVMPL